MTLDVILIVLLAAVLHASWNTLVKSAGDKLLDTVLLSSAMAVLAIVALPVLPAIAPASWPYAIASGIVHVPYFLLLAGAYRTGDMTLAYPLMRGGGPLIVAIASGPLIGEYLTPTAWIGVVLICGAVLALGFADRKPGPAHATTVALALCNAVVIAAYTFIDGLGARASGQPLSYVLWANALAAAPMLIWAGFRRSPASMLIHLRARWHLGLIGGACAIAAYGLSLWAMTRAAIAPVAALRETSIFFALAMATVMLRERPKPARIAAAVAMVAGAAALRLG